ncbi:disease resistance protein PIK6-NP-like [Triticum dicoccoides]|uniref:disease resistance protein PIK6-NP-like n=1 Tax=Triticum dicoccoides TaxID=85692 RepID=UPI001891E48D|nr:disease resistance protein PIK6-NP-like [Triticum dicoccoides]
MAAEIVSVTMGVVNPLIGKLTELLGEEYRKLTGVRRQVMFLKDELSSMKALLDKLELVDKLDPQAKDWRDHVREMSYDMENCIDDFMHDLEGADGKKGFVRKMAQRLRRLGRRHQIANQIEELKIHAIEENARCQRYNIDDSIHSSSTVVAVDPRIPSRGGEQPAAEEGGGLAATRMYYAVALFFRFDTPWHGSPAFVLFCRSLSAAQERRTLSAWLESGGSARL